MDGKAFFLFMDNLNAHRNKEVRALMSALKITPIYNISYSPDFNCIEAVFAQVKRKFNKARLNHLVQEKEFDMFANIKKAFQVITPQLVQACEKRSVSILKAFTINE